MPLIKPHLWVQAGLEYSVCGCVGGCGCGEAEGGAGGGKKVKKWGLLPGPGAQCGMSACVAGEIKWPYLAHGVSEGPDSL